MNIHHHSIRGKCIFCGLRTSTFHSSGTDGQEFRVDGRGNILFSDPIYFECPGARSLLLKLFSFIFLPFVYLTGGWLALSFAFILGIMIFGVLLSPSKQRWLGMSEVREEYESLINVIPRGKDSFYLKKIDEALKPLFGFRDKAMKSIYSIASTPTDEIETQINIIRDKCQTLDDPDLTAMYRNQIRDLYQIHSRIQEMQLFLEKFEASKKCVVSSIQLLKNKMVIAEQNNDEKGKHLILEDLKTLHDIYARVNEPQTKAPKDPFQQSTGEDGFDPDFPRIKLPDLEPPE
ncbi:MAG: hypothetical protein HQM09_23545 [Candidatus Riflebacteria bacterium]|nr:hypothetical protein [Candidatus Riflebacteria bacterium]